LERIAALSSCTEEFQFPLLIREIVKVAAGLNS
jgi:hypothetical protein